MRGFPNRPLSFSLFLVGLALPAFAQNPGDAVHVPSFLPPGVGDVPSSSGFSGLAVDPRAASASPAPVGAPSAAAVSTVTPPAPIPPPVAAAPAPPPVQVVAPTPVANVPASSPAAFVPAPAPAPAPVAPEAKPADLVPVPVTTATLPNVSPESVGLKIADSLGVDIWKGTPHIVAEHLLSIFSATNSPVLNRLMYRVLATAAVPPEGDPETAQAYMSARIEKLMTLGHSSEAWALAKQADAKLVDPMTFRMAAETALTNGEDKICEQLGDIAKSNTAADWQEMIIVCKLRAKDAQAAQVGLDVLRTQSNRDNVFLGIGEKLASGSIKALPFQLTPMTPPTAALLQIANLPLPASLFARADTAYTHAILQIPAQQDVAKLALAERAAEKGIVDAADLAAAYREITFSKEALAAPLSSPESGLRLRALLFNAAEADKEPANRMAYALRFFQTANASALNSAGMIAAQMMGDIKPDPTAAKNAPTFARIYMIAGKSDLALEWLRLAQGSSVSVEELQPLWPQFALGGFESEANYGANFDKWFAAAIQGADAQTIRDVIAPTLLYLDACGLKVPESAWVKTFIVPENERKSAFSPIFLERMNAAANGGRRAEMVALAAILAGDGELSLPAGLAITKALRQAGFSSEAAIFARQAVALLGKN